MQGVEFERARRAGLRDDAPLTLTSGPTGRRPARVGILLAPGASLGQKHRNLSSDKHHSKPAGTGPAFGQNPFAALSSEGLRPGPENDTGQTGEKPAVARRSRGRVDIIRQTAHRGGKTVTVVANFVGIGLPEKEQLAKAMQKACGTGGTVKNGRIEIQGDKRAEVARILTEAGFRPVFAGG